MDRNCRCFRSGRRLVWPLAASGGTRLGHDHRLRNVHPGSGESRTLRVSSTYQTILICNDVGSAGTIEGAIGDYPAVSLAPGICNANTGQYGDRITVRNISSRTATGLFQSAGTKPLGPGR